MRLENAVSKRKRPWYMEPIEHQRGHLSKLTAEAADLARELSETGIVVIRKSVSAAICDRAREDFYLFCSLNKVRLEPARDGQGRLPRIINLHGALQSLFRLFSKNYRTLAVQRLMFEAEPCLYTSIYFEYGSEQAIHRDTPVFSTKPEYFY